MWEAPVAEPPASQSNWGDGPRAAAGTRSAGAIAVPAAKQAKAAGESQAIGAAWDQRASLRAQLVHCCGAKCTLRAHTDAPTKAPTGGRGAPVTRPQKQDPSRQVAGRPPTLTGMIQEGSCSLAACSQPANDHTVHDHPSPSVHASSCRAGAACWQTEQSCAPARTQHQCTHSTGSQRRANGRTHPTMQAAAAAAAATTVALQHCPAPPPPPPTGRMT
jgi:hypothetical protein